MREADKERNVRKGSWKQNLGNMKENDRKISHNIEFDRISQRPCQHEEVVEEMKVEGYKQNG